VGRAFGTVGKRIARRKPGAPSPEAKLTRQINKDRSLETAKRVPPLIRNGEIGIRSPKGGTRKKKKKKPLTRTADGGARA